MQLRERDLSTRDLLDLGAQLRARTAAAGAKLLVNDRVDLCWALGADGVQVRHDGLPAGTVRRLLGRNKLLGVSVHAIDDALRAEADGADFVLFGPVYETPSKRAYGPPQGIDRLAEVVRAVRIPVFAIGGVTGARVDEVVRAGARGIGVIRAILGAANPHEAAVQLHDRLTKSLGGPPRRT